MRMVLSVFVCTEEKTAITLPASNAHNREPAKRWGSIEALGNGVRIVLR